MATHDHAHSSSHGHHDHSLHDHAMPVDHDSARRMKWALCLTTIFMVLELITGMLSSSLVLIADGIHMLSDVLALGLALVAVSFARKAPDDLRSYGYQRGQVLAAFVNGIILFMLTLWIVIEALGRLRDPGIVIGIPMLGVAIAGFIVNIIVAKLLHGGDEHDLNLRSVWLHVLSDLLGSVAAIVAAVLIITLGWQRADPILSLLAAVLILRSAWLVTRQSAHVLLEGTPERISLEEVRQSLVALQGVQRVHDVHVWGLSHRESLASLHLVVDTDVSRDAVIVQGRTLLAERFGISHATIQIEGANSHAEADCHCAVDASAVHHDHDHSSPPPSH